MKFTLQELRNKCITKLQDPFAKLYTSQEIDACINEAQDFVVSETECCFRVFDLQVTADNEEYDLRDVDTSGKDLAIKVLEVLWQEDTFLKIYNQREFDISNSGWRTEASGTPTKCAVDGNLLTLYPAPDTSDVGGNYSIKLLTIAYANDLTEPASQCIIPARLQRYIPIYVLNSLTNKDANNEVLKKLLQKERSREGILKSARKFMQKIDLVSEFKNSV